MLSGINIEVQSGRIKQYENNYVFRSKYSFYATDKIKLGTDHIFNIRAFWCTLLFMYSNILHILRIVGSSIKTSSVFSNILHM